MRNLETGESLLIAFYMAGNVFQYRTKGVVTNICEMGEIVTIAIEDNHFDLDDNAFSFVLPLEEELNVSKTLFLIPTLENSKVFINCAFLRDEA